MKFSNELYKFLYNLKTGKASTNKGFFIAEGKKNLEMILNKNIDYKMIICSKEFFNANSNFFLDIDSSKLVITTKYNLNRISNLETNETILTVLFRKDLDCDINQLDFKKSCIVLDKIQNPSNLGSIVRIAHWFGLEQIVCSVDSVKISNSKAIQTSMGSFLFVRVFYTDLVSFLSETKLPVYGAVADTLKLSSVKIPHDAVIVFGNESHGFRTSVSSIIKNWIAIPRFTNTIDSLSLSIAAGIVCYAWKL